MASLPAPLSQTRQTQRTWRRRAEPGGTKAKAVPVLLLRLVVHFLLDQLTVHSYYLSSKGSKILDTGSPEKGKTRSTIGTEDFFQILYPRSQESFTENLMKRNQI